MKIFHGTLGGVIALIILSVGQFAFAIGSTPYVKVTNFGKQTIPIKFSSLGKVHFANFNLSVPEPDVYSKGIVRPVNFGTYDSVPPAKNPSRVVMGAFPDYVRAHASPYVRKGVVRTCQFKPENNPACLSH
jgi:hypothetical protein